VITGKLGELDTPIANTPGGRRDEHSLPRAHISRLVESN